MSTGLQFDEEAARHVEAPYKTPDVVEQRREVLRVLDLEGCIERRASAG